MMDAPITRDELKKQTQRKIIDVAMGLYIENGYAKPQMKDIYKGAGIAKKTLYRYFTSKEDLAMSVEYILIKELADFQKEFVGSLEDMPAYEKLKLLLKDHIINLVAEKPYYFRFFAQFDVNITGEYTECEASRSFLNFMKTHESMHIKLFKAGQLDNSIRKDLDPVLTTRSIDNAVIALAERVVIRELRLVDEQSIGREMLDYLMDMYLEHIKPR